METFAFAPIGHFISSLENAHEAPRQPNINLPNTEGHIRLLDNHNFIDAVRDLDGFSKIWVIFHFHHNAHWNPTVSPPRGGPQKRGVFATRSPYRPNPIGMSCLDLKKIDGLNLYVGASDLLNGTPILDIKPYLPYADSHPLEKIGWLQNLNAEIFSIRWHDLAKQQVEFLESQGQSQLRGFVINHLEFEPNDSTKKRTYYIDTVSLLAYRTWRIQFEVNLENKTVDIIALSSGYSDEELNSELDPYKDKVLHKKFINYFKL